MFSKRYNVSGRRFQKTTYSTAQKEEKPSDCRNHPTPISSPSSPLALLQPESDSEAHAGETPAFTTHALHSYPAHELKCLSQEEAVRLITYLAAISSNEDNSPPLPASPEAAHATD